MEAYEGYWRKVPSVKRLVFKSIPEATTRLAVLKRGEVDVAYLLDATLRRGGQARSEAQARVLRRHRHHLSRLLRHVGSEVAVGRPARAPGRQPGDRSQGDQRGGDAGRLAARPATSCPKSFEFALPLEPHPLRSGHGRRSCSPRRAIPNGFDGGDLYPWPPYFSTGEAIIGYLGAVGIRTRMRTMERAAILCRAGHEEAQGAVHVRRTRSTATPSSRLSEIVPSDGAFAYGGYPDVDELYKRQARENGPEEARGHAARDPADALRPRAVRARSTTTSGRAASGRGWRTRR